MLIKELFTEYNISTDNIPVSILEIELEEDIKNFTKGTQNSDLYNFVGTHEIDKNTTIQLQVIINLTEITTDDYTLITNPKDSELSVREAGERLIWLTSYEAVEYHYTGNGFTGLETYNILGGLVGQA